MWFTYSLLLFQQGRHVKTGQLAAIKVMNVTEVSANPKIKKLQRCKEEQSNHEKVDSL